MSELFDGEASKESNEHEVTDDTTIVLKCVNSMGRIWRIYEPEGSDDTIILLKHVNSVRRKVMTLSNLLLQWLIILNGDAGLGLMRQEGEGQAYHSYPLDPTWMQRSYVEDGLLDYCLVDTTMATSSAKSLLWAFGSFIRTNSRRRRPHLLLTWRWNLGGSGSMTSTVSTEWPRHAGCQTDSRLWLLQE